MTCIKTGADVYIGGHNAVVHGDLFEVGDTYILACGDDWDKCTDYAGLADYRINLKMYGWETCGYRVIAAPKHRCDEFSYDGVAL